MQRYVSGFSDLVSAWMREMAKMEVLYVYIYTYYYDLLLYYIILLYDLL